MILPVAPWQKLPFFLFFLSINLALLSTARANDFSDVDFSLRFPAALNNFSPYADVAAKGGSTAAGKFGSSANPAAMAWISPSAFNYALSAQYSNVAFSEGTHLDFLSEAVGFDLHDFGCIRFSFGQVTSNDKTIRDLPVVFTYDLNAGRVEWAKRWGAWSLGAGFTYAESETSFRTDKFILADADRHTSLVRLGALWEPAHHWLAGIFGDFAYAPTRTDYLTPTRFGLVGSQSRDITRQGIIRPGISYEWRENALLQLDYQYGRYWNETGSLEISRFTAGADLPLARFFFLRAGAELDTRGDFGWTAGFGFYPHKGVTFDFAYQNNAFPELQRELGHSRTLNASVSLQF